MRISRDSLTCVQAPVAGDEHVLAAFVGERLTGEAAVQRRHLQAGHVQQAEPLVLRRPPQGACPAAVEGEVDPVVARPEPDRVRDRLVLVAAVDAGADVVVTGSLVTAQPVPLAAIRATETAARLSPIILSAVSRSPDRTRASRIVTAG
jgi:hypothetical protein